jgi:hypothetical protein
MALIAVDLSVLVAAGGWWMVDVWLRKYYV